VATTVATLVVETSALAARSKSILAKGAAMTQTALASSARLMKRMVLFDFAFVL